MQLPLCQSLTKHETSTAFCVATKCINRLVFSCILSKYFNWKLDVFTTDYKLYLLGILSSLPGFICKRLQFIGTSLKLKLL